MNRSQPINGRVAPVIPTIFNNVRREEFITLFRLNHLNRRDRLESGLVRLRARGHKCPI